MEVISVTLELGLSIIGSVTGIIGAVIGVLGISHNRFLAIRQFMEYLEDPIFIDARHRIYNHDSSQQISPNDKDAALITNYFHHWGLLVKKRYLPLWVFDYGSGARVIYLYEQLQKYIAEHRRLHNDAFYAINFEWLYYKLRSRQNHKRLWRYVVRKKFNYLERQFKVQ